MIADFPKQIEMHFWDLAIPAMTQNKFVQKIVRTTYAVVKEPDLRNRSILIIAGCLAGFIAGLITYSVIL